MSDLISRCELFNRLATIPAPPEANDLKAEIYKVIQSMETVDQETERGEWIDEADKYDASFGIHDYRCSNCNSYADEFIGGHEWYTASKPNFCPCCGAKMEAE